MFIPVNNLSTNEAIRIDPKTIYKESFTCDFMPQKTTAILPKPNLRLPCNATIDPKSIYKVNNNIQKQNKNLN